ncbi:HNH endonuclease [Kitasatospora camelliae]|uniref:HNH endonuclease signature motif containing protein n=1 Tax=Kitasatospora camelliae TaxID=3156397 RepID=A0AAU8K1W1_9ACTN
MAPTPTHPDSGDSTHHQTDSGRVQPADGMFTSLFSDPTGVRPPKHSWTPRRSQPGDAPETPWTAQSLAIASQVHRKESPAGILPHTSTGRATEEKFAVRQAHPTPPVHGAVFLPAQYPSAPQTEVSVKVPALSLGADLEQVQNPNLDDDGVDRPAEPEHDDSPIRFAPSPPTASSLEAPSRALSPDGRICPVCDKGGLLPGQYRHVRCEGRARPAVSEASSPPSVAARRAPEDVREYLRLVSVVEEREVKTRGQRRAGQSARPVRIPQAREAVLLRCGGLCENPSCAGQPDDVTDDGRPLLEVDHIEEIAAGGRDHPEQMAALCPNCHAAKTRGRRRSQLRADLATAVGEAHLEWLTPPVAERPRK